MFFDTYIRRRFVLGYICRLDETSPIGSRANASAVLLGQSQQPHTLGMLVGVIGELGERDCPEKALVCYSQEQLGVTPLGPADVGRRNYYSRRSGLMQIETFRVTAFDGEPRSTDFLAEPDWFPFNQLPTDRLCRDDRQCITSALLGQQRYYLFHRETYPDGTSGHALVSIA